MGDGTRQSRSTGQPARRQVVKFTFFKVDPAWRLIDPGARERAKADLCHAVDSFAGRMLIRSYSLAGMRGDADFLLWQIAEQLDDVQDLTTRLFSTSMGAHLSIPHSFLAMTRRSVYVSPEEGAARLAIQPTDAPYLFVYPFVKTRAWYALSQEERQRMMDNHIAIGRRYPSVKLNTTYSFGLDDQEFVVAFETDEPADFLDLVMELRETETSLYTLRDTPIFTCVAMSLRDALDRLGAPGDALPGARRPATEPRDGWTRVADLAELPEGASKVVYFQGEQVALFHVGGSVHAIGDRCTHANASLAEGTVEDGTITCPHHGSRFDLASGLPLRAPAARPVPTYRVRIEDGAVLLAHQEPQRSRGAPAVESGRGG